MHKKQNILTEKILIIGIFFFFTFSSFSQIDSSDVFIIGDKNNVEFVDTVFDYGIRTSIKYEIARLTFGEIIFSVERVFKGRKIAIEPELNFIWLGQDAYFFNYLTDDRINLKSFFSPSGSVGVGCTIKRYLSKNNAPYGPYFSLKIRERFAQIDQENKSNSIFNSPFSGPTNYSDGFINLVDLSLNLGVSVWKKNWFQFDFLIGASATHSYFEYGEYNLVDNVRIWTPKKASIFLPSMNFGFRMGIATDFFRLKLNKYRHVFSP